MLPVIGGAVPAGWRWGRIVMTVKVFDWKNAIEEEGVPVI